MKSEIAALLLEIKAVFLSPQAPFTWASGIKSPIYCDNRLILSYPKVRDRVEDGLVQLIKTHYPDAEAIIGTATAGIPHAAIVADKLALPMGYARSEAKDHGRTNQIEGFFKPGTKVVVVEDLISTGGSVIAIVNVLRSAGLVVLGIASIFTYNLSKSEKRLRDANLINHSLTDFQSLVKVAVEKNYIENSDLGKCIAFQNNPDDPKWIDA
ncbi:MAG: orotate phosphoribosyltransferase [Candidatus Izemoplasmatales bacterium]|jgi:orotate phosphoribosyltransferase